MTFSDISSVPQPQTVSQLNFPNTGITPTVYLFNFSKLFGVSCIGIWILPTTKILRTEQYIFTVQKCFTMLLLLTDPV